MSITVKETRRSRSVTLKTAQREYTAWGDIDPDAIYAAVTAGTDATAGSSQAPSAIGSLVSDTYESNPRDNDARVHDITIGYALPEDKDSEPPDEGDETVSFDITPQTSHVTHSISTVNKYAASGTAIDHKGAIGVTNDEIQGVDIYIPSMSYTVTKTVQASSVTNSFVNTLVQAAFKVSNPGFRGGSAGEDLYMGASGSPQGGGLYQLAHKFIRSPNITGRSLGDITGISKQGWEYLWAQYEDTEDATAKAIAKRAIGAYVEQVYESTNLATATGLTG